MLFNAIFWRIGIVMCAFWYITQTSHIKNGIYTLKNQYFNSQNNNQAAMEPLSNAFCMYFGSL